MTRGLFPGTRGDILRTHSFGFSDIWQRCNIRVLWLSEIFEICGDLRRGFVTFGLNFCKWPFVGSNSRPLSLDSVRKGSRMARAKKKAASTDSTDVSQHYKQLNDLPEDRRRAYESILEDFDKQGELLFEKL